MEEHHTRKQYDRQFKVHGVRLITDGGQSVAIVSRDPEVGRGQLQRWKREFEEKPEHAFPLEGRMSEENKQVEDLRQELARIKEEREKKGIAAFSERHA
jgi:transposase